MSREITKEQFKMAYPELYQEIEQEGKKQGRAEGFAQGEAMGVKSKEPAKTPLDMEQERESARLIKIFKSLPEDVQTSLSILDYNNLLSLSKAGDSEAKDCLRHWVGSGPSFWDAWDGSPMKYLGYLRDKKAGRGKRS